MSETSHPTNVLPVNIPLLELVKGGQNVIVTWPEVHGGFEWKPVMVELVIAAWVLLTLAGAVKMVVDKRFWNYAKAYPAEAIFAATYALFLFAYNSQEYTWEFFPRFAIPLVPFLILLYLDHLPRDRRIVWSVGLFNVMFTAYVKMPPVRTLIFHVLHHAHKFA